VRHASLDDLRGQDAIAAAHIEDALRPTWNRVE
jgi:hypothetical protein